MRGSQASVSTGRRLSHERFANAVPVVLIKKSAMMDIDRAEKSRQAPAQRKAVALLV